jgi:hypothetical protein
MIKLTATQETTPCKWLHPYEEKPVLRRRPFSEVDSRLPGTDAVSAAGTAISLVDLFSIYNCPATSITAAKATANIAPANCGTSFIILYFHLLQTACRPRERVIQTSLAQCDSEQAKAK